MRPASLPPPSAPSSFNRSSELDDILEESSLEEDTDEGHSSGYLPTSANSPDCSGRLSGRSSCSSEEQDNHNNNNNNNNNKCRVKDPVCRLLSGKLSLDSGFSDSSDTNPGRRKDQATGRKLKSAVVHETHALNNSNKMHHVSKVYFYSVSDILQDSSQAYGPAAEDDGPPPPDPLRPDSSAPSTPRISAPASELDYLDVMLERCPALDSAPFQRSPRVRAGASSLRRRRDDRDRSGRSSPALRSNTPTQNFPITNGSLYSDLSLNRKVSETQRAKRRGERDSFNLTSSSLHSDLDSFDNPLDASQHSSNHSSNTSYSPVSSSCSIHTPSPNPSSHLSSSPTPPAPSPSPPAPSSALSHPPSLHSSLSTSLPLDFGLNSTTER